MKFAVTIQILVEVDSDQPFDARRRAVAQVLDTMKISNETTNGARALSASYVSVTQIEPAPEEP